MLARAVRSRLLIGTRVGAAAHVNTAADAVAFITPLRIGGEPLRYVGFVRAGASPPAVLASFAVEVAVDAVLLVLLSVGLTAAFAREGVDGMARLIELLRSPTARWVAALTAAAAVAGAAFAARFHRHLPPDLTHTLRESWRIAWSRPHGVLAGVVAATLVSVAARTAILPVLAPVRPGLTISGMVLGSYALCFGPAVLPTPAGAGGVELAFLAGFRGALDAGERAELLALWRWYTLVLPVLVGLVLLARAGVARWRAEAPG